MDLGVVLSAERLAAARAAGLWPDRLITDDLDRQARERPQQVAFTDHNSTVQPNTTASSRKSTKTRNDLANCSKTLMMRRRT